MPKALREKSSTSQIRHSPLGSDIEAPVGKLKPMKTSPRDEQASFRGRGGRGQGRGRGSVRYVSEDNDEDDMDDDREDVMDAKVLKEAKLQREEILRDVAIMSSKPSNDNMKKNISKSKYEDDDEDDNFEDIEEEDDDEEEERMVHFDGDFVTSHSNNEMSDAEELLVQRFLNASKTETRSLADIIMEKIRQKEIETEETASAQENSSLPPKVIEVYTAVGKLLAHYKAGKLPKALKMLPHLKNWEEVLWLTRPDEWSPGATYACTRIFTSNLNVKLAQKFFNMILLEKCRDDIRSNQKLNYHLYMSLKKALFKPAAFYKGIILPLAQSGTCSLREAIIFGSVLAKVSIQGNHSAAALLRLIEMPYSGCTSIFIKILLNKKYALPRRVVDALVDHFVSFEGEARTLPVLWHQALLVFSQRYKLELTDEQKERLKQLLRVQQHHSITHEVRRELFTVRM